MPKPPQSVITIYGRKPVLEALQQVELTIYRVHLANSNQPGPIIREIESLALQRGIECHYHERLALSRISKNRKQDQGVAADVINPNAVEIEAFPKLDSPSTRLMALENITNPQNLGMIIRTVAASAMDGLLLPRRGCAKLDSLVIKASAGAIFRSNLIFCDDLMTALNRLKNNGFSVYGLALHDSQPLGTITMQNPYVIVLGNETSGLSTSVCKLCDQLLHIPMHNGVESLNVSVAAGILAFMECRQN